MPPHRPAAGLRRLAVVPYLALATVRDLARSGVIPGIDPDTAARNTVKAFGKGLLKIMSKMGVSTVSSYTGAQIFEALGLDQEVIDRAFAGTTSRLGGIGFDVLAEEVRRRHAAAYAPTLPRTAGSQSAANTSGAGKANRTCSTRRPSRLQHATRTGSTTCSRSTPPKSTSRPKRS